MKRNFYLWLDLFILFLLLCYAIYRDTQLIRQFPADLRNRVVGARLIRDGKLPYFYKWKKGDKTRYLDYNNSGGVTLSNMTASPFMHELMLPFSNLPQYSISIIWLVAEYIFLALIMLTGILLSTDNLHRLLVLNAGIAFIFTEAWINHIFVGQMYLLIAALSACIALLLIKHTSLASQAIAGLLTMIVIFIRPIYILFLIPFIFHYAYKRVFVISTLIASFLFCIFLFVSPFQRSLWLQYNAGIKEHIKMHQGGVLTFARDQSLPQLRYFEGYDMQEVNRLEAEGSYIKQSENGNIFVFYKLITHHQISLFWLNLTCIVLIMFLYWRYDLLIDATGFDSRKAVFLGLSLYMIMEVFLPIHRHQYNTVQFFPLVVIFFSNVRSYRDPAFLFCVAGILLNITNTELIPLRHSIGEAFILFAILLAVFKRTKEFANGPKGDYHRRWTSRTNSSI